MSSSRSITAARARRAGEQAPPMSGTRPGTSIGSHAAFAPQQQYQQPSPNVRMARGQPPQHQMQPQQIQQQQMSQQQPSNGLPFTKLSISDAIGLITLRLGRVEQFIIDVENGEQGIGGLSQTSSSFIPENSKIVDSSVITTIINRIDSLEKRETSPNNSEQMTVINNEIAGISLEVKKLNEEYIKSNLLLSNHTEQIFRFNRTLTETKDLLQNLIMKVDAHIQETNDKFIDYEYALTEIEKNVQNPASENLIFAIGQGQGQGQDQHQDQDQDQHQDQDQDQDQDNSAILSVDLKNIIKQELANV